MTRVFGWALLMLFTGLATAWLRGVVDPLLPPGDWHAMLSGLFAAVTWPSLTWSLRGFASRHLVELFSLPWWV
ncbi:hypothetical protein [Bradyrhizobium sp. McL0615]|uniref:hypothetical protein n=1 Tax=Bradyrhizobium sp. McL0615 TaxID=3415673 RepID=UPI003CEC31C4